MRLSPLRPTQIPRHRATSQGVACLLSYHRPEGFIASPSSRGVRKGPPHTSWTTHLSPLTDGTMWKLLAVALLVTAVQGQTKDQRSSSYEAADSYQQSAYYPASEYDNNDSFNGFGKLPSGGFFNKDIDTWINLGLNVLILLVIGFVAFTLSASVGSVIENADRSLGGYGLDTIEAIERLQKLYDTVMAARS